MEKDIYFENINISISTVTSFKRAYEEKKKEVISDLRKNLKEKYNIDINGSKEDVKHIKATCNNSSTSI